MKSSFFLGIFFLISCWILSFFSDFLPLSLSTTAIRTLGITLLIATFWVFETIEIAATSIIPLFLFPLAGVLSSGEVAVAYGSNIVLLFMTGFFIATALSRWQLDKRCALFIIQKIGKNPALLILGFMLATALSSMFISNTATALMMLPIAIATAKSLEANFSKKEKFMFGGALMLAVAYGANIGGIATPIGTPPNLIFLAQIEENFPNLPEINFFQWIQLGIPTAAIFLFLAWFYLVKIQFQIPRQFNTEVIDIIDREIKKLGPISEGEKYVAFLFVLCAFLWIFRAALNLGDFTISGWSTLLGIKSAQLKDTAVGAFICVLMFTISGRDRQGNRKKLLDWESAKQIPWEILLLFGGGIAISKAFTASGLSEFVGNSLQSNLSDWPLFLIIIIICTLVTFLTEITSNTALTTLLMPILAVMATAFDIPPAYLMLPAAMSASCAFMLPVATPPNAIVYSQNYFPVSTMAKSGFVLNIIGVILISLAMLFISLTHTLPLLT